MNIVFVLEIIGTVAFAFSGALVAINRKMDIFGVCILGMTTAVGGGIVRDLILGSTPPAAFLQPVYALTAIGVSILAFLPIIRKIMNKTEAFSNNMMLIMDSLGLGIFTVVGIEKAFPKDGNVFLAIFVGMLTGVGGGVIRDMFAGLTPSIFVKHFYASASLVGAVVCILTWEFFGSTPAIIAGSAVVVILRLLAAHFRWNLPVAKDPVSKKNNS